MADIIYLDFDLLIQRSGVGYRARVVDSPAGQATAEFALPFSDLELENLLLRSDRPGRDAFRDASRRQRSDVRAIEAARDFGGRLFEAVFKETVGSCLLRSLDEADRQGAGLRIRLRLADVPELVDLPWEYLYNPTFDRFLVLSSKTPLVRYLELPERIQPLAVEPPLRILVVISSPSDYPWLDVDQEWSRLSEALSDLEQQGLVALERLEQASPGALRHRLRQGMYHILHFIGHGDFDQTAQDGVLLLEDEQGKGELLSGQYLGMLLHDHEPLRLVILNACKGARTSRSDPFAGTAQKLVQQGIPAVIAMQFEVTDQAAIAFAQEFYAAVADDYPVDAALAEARKAMVRDHEAEWGTPVLHMRAPDGRIFGVAPVSEEEQPSTRVAELYQQVQSALPHFPDDLRDQVLQNRRAELNRLLTHVQANRVTSIVGMGGIGKTTLARALVEMRSAEIRLPIWIDFSIEPEATLNDLLTKFAGYLSWPELLSYRDDQRPPDQNDLLRLTGRLLDLPPTWLVFDNLESILDDAGHFYDAGIDSFFEVLLTRQHQARLIITSRVLPALRNDRVLGGGFDEPTLRLGGLPMSAGVSFLRGCGLEQDPEAKLAEIVENVAGHPLALRMLVSEATTWGVTDLLADRELWQDSISEVGHRLFVRLRPEEQQLTAHFSVFRRPQPLKVLAALAGGGRAGRECVRGLLDKSLLNLHDGGDTQLYRLHPLVQEIANAELNQEERNAAHHSAYEYYRGIPLPPSSQWRGLDDVTPLLEAHYHAVQAGALDRAAAILLEHALPDYLERWGAQDRLIKLSRQTLGQTPEGMSHADYLAGLGYSKLASDDVTKVYRARLCRQLGKSARYLSEYRRALASYEQGITLLEGESDERELVRLYSESAVILNWLGERQQEALERCLRGLEMLEGADDRQGQVDKAELHRSVGIILGSLGDHAEAFSHSKRAHEIFQTLGMASRAFDMYNNMGTQCGAQGRHQEALNYYRASLQYYEEKEHRLGAATTSLNLGGILHFLHRFEEARPYYASALEWFSEIGDQGGRMISRGNLGELLMDTGDSEAALPLLEQSLVDSQAIDEKERRPYILYLLSKAHANLGRTTTARNRLEQAITLAGQSGNRPVMEMAQELLARLQAE